MLNISEINNINTANYDRISKEQQDIQQKQNGISQDLKPVSSSNLQAYHPSFCGETTNKSIKFPSIISDKMKLHKIKSKLDDKSLEQLKSLQKKGILKNTDSNDGSSVVDNLYKIATEPRIEGLNDSLIIAEVINALDNPFSITQKFGDIPEPVAQELSAASGQEFPKSLYNVSSHACVAASIEFNLASKKPAEFARFAQGLSSSDYSVKKNIKMSDISGGTAEGLWVLREFGIKSQLNTNWEDVSLEIKPDRNAIVRARVQTSYKDPDERSCVDVLIQSALLNLGSQHSYDALSDERQIGKFNPEKYGLSDFEKNLVEQIVMETPKVSVLYQDIDGEGKLRGYHAEPEETKQHILKSLELGHNVIIGYTHFDDDGYVDGGHEITIIGYGKDENGDEFFICNDTDDNLDEPITVSVEKLLPLIHHAGISKEALSSNDEIVESWREIIDEFKQILEYEKQEKQGIQGTQGNHISQEVQEIQVRQENQENAENQINLTDETLE